MITTINKDDYVKHKTIFLNGGMAMQVADVKGYLCLCTRLDLEGLEGKSEDVWIPCDELVLVKYG